MTPDDLWIEMAQFDGANADRLWDGSAATDDAPAWYGRVATLLRASAATATEDELAGESEIVARMQAAILEPATEDELAGESEIVARMQATILESAWAAGSDDVGDGHRPRHLRAATPRPAGARRRQGARVVRRIVAVKAAAVTTVVAIGVTTAAATTGIVATVVVPALSSHEPEPHQEPETLAADSGSSTDGSGESNHGVGDGTGDDPVVTMDPAEPLVCMLDLDCLLQEVKEAAAAPPNAMSGDAVVTMDPEEPLVCMLDLDCLLHEVEEAAMPTTEPPATPPTTEPPATPPTTEPPATPPTTEPPATPPTTEPPATPPTTEPPPPTTEPPPTTTTTAPPAEPPAELAAPLGVDTRSATSDAGTTDAGTGSEPAPAG